MRYCSCSSSGFPYVEARLVYWSLRWTATFVKKKSIDPCCWPFLSTFLPPLPFSDLSSHNTHLSCGLPRFLQPSFFFVSDIFGGLSSFIPTMFPTHIVRLLTMLPTMQTLVPTSSRRYFLLRLSTLIFQI